MSTTETTTAPATFTAGTTVTATSACDHNCVWTFKIAKRTAKFLTLVNQDNGKPFRVGIKINPINGNEFAMPLGSYSMAPVIRPGR